MEKIGKIFKYMNQDNIADYSETHFDILWYLLKLTKVNRCVSYESLREFLIRYLLITNTDLNQSALEFIDKGILIQGSIQNEYFTFHMKDMINLMGFSCSDFKYNIKGTLDDFILEYRKLSFNTEIKKGSRTKKDPNKISKDILLLNKIQLKSLMHLENLSISFKDKIDNLGDEKLKKVLTFTDFVMKSIEMKVFEEYSNAVPEVDKNFKERFLKENVVCFNVFKDMDKENLAEIYEQILPEELMQSLAIKGINDIDIIRDLQMINTFIIFAYGVKHNFIKLSDNAYSLYHDVNYTDFQIEFENLLGEDGEIYTTQFIYDIWEMDEWIHLLP